MNKTKLKAYAPKARKDFIAAVTARANLLGLSDNGGNLDIAVGERKGDIAIIAGREWPVKVYSQREDLIKRMKNEGFNHTVEAVAYTWFNRFAALRYMEIHDYLDHGHRALSNREGGMPEILNYAAELDLPGLNKAKAIELKLAGNKDNELYKLILVAQCNALSSAMPFLFERIDDETELLLPDNLLLTDSVIAKLVADIPEEDWQEVEIIGWLYQFYISEKKDEVIGKVVKSEDIPAATQLFTPNWIVKYMVQNSVGRLWMMANPSSTLKSQWPYYIEPAEQTPEVQAQLNALIQTRLDEDGGNLNPETITVLDPACGSGHILVEAYDLLKAIYLERGYQTRAIPRLILEKNLYGIDIDDRAAQMAGFALLMKARADDRRLFDSPPKLNVLSLQESKGMQLDQLLLQLQTYGIKQAYLNSLLDIFTHAKTFGSLIQIPRELNVDLETMANSLQLAINNGDLYAKVAAQDLLPLVAQALVLGMQFDAVVANPPYMNSRNMQEIFSEFVEKNYEGVSDDAFAAFVKRGKFFSKEGTKLAFVTPFTWMYLSSYEGLRHFIIEEFSLSSLVQLEYNAFEPACVPVCTFVCDASKIPNYSGLYIDLSDFKGIDAQPIKTLEAVKNNKSYWAKVFQLETISRIPSYIFSLGLSDIGIEAISSGNTISKVADPRQGIKTGDNGKFLRLWWEVDSSKLAFPNISEKTPTDKKWYPIQKGGRLRRWYGNNEYVVNWENDGYELKNFKDDNGKLRSRPQNLDYRFREGTTWSTLTVADFSMRYCPAGFLSESAGSICYPKNVNDVFYLLGYFCSTTFNYFIRATSPTLSYSEGAVSRAPIIFDCKDEVSSIAKSAVNISKSDWDLRETSVDYSRSELVKVKSKSNLCEDAFLSLLHDCEDRMLKLVELEKQNNDIFLKVFDLQLNSSQDGYGKRPALREPDRNIESENLISFAIGCMMGRYSLDEQGLIYAHYGNTDFDNNHYKSFLADGDGIVPITDELWFEDDATKRIREFLVAVWGSETPDINMVWLAKNLGSKGTETPEESIRRYLSGPFYKNHLQTYKKRPIYWLFSSGKQGAFKALIYLHRYNEGTLARMRSEYVVPLTGKMLSRIEMLEKDAESAASTAARTKISKEIEVLRKQHIELLAYDEKLRHFADMRIQLDLDDGVKVNYGRFGDLLAEVKTVTGGTED